MGRLVDRYVLGVPTEVVRAVCLEAIIRDLGMPADEPDLIAQSGRWELVTNGVWNKPSPFRFQASIARIIGFSPCCLGLKF